MREMEQRAYSYLGRNPILYMDMVEALRRGDGIVSAVRTDGVLVHVRKSGAYLLAAGSVEAAEALGSLVQQATQVSVHDRGNAELLRDKLGLEVMECRAAAYIDPTHPGGRGFDLRQVNPLGPEQEDAVLDSFPGEFERDEIRERLWAGALHGVIQRGDLQGMVGIYPEGGIGMLAVRQDLGEQEAVPMLGGLVAYITGWCLEKDFAPFAHIPVEDEGMLALYEQTGYTVCEQNVYWLG